MDLFVQGQTGKTQHSAEFSAPDKKVGRIVQWVVRLTQELEVTGSSHILPFLFPLIQEGQLSVIGKSMCTKYWLTTKEV